MSKPLTDTEALAHYRDELNRTRTAIKALADMLDAGHEDTGWDTADELYRWDTADELYRILGERP